MTTQDKIRKLPDRVRPEEIEAQKLEIEEKFQFEMSPSQKKVLGLKTADINAVTFDTKDINYLCETKYFSLSGDAGGYYSV